MERTHFKENRMFMISVFNLPGNPSEATLNEAKWKGPQRSLTNGRAGKSSNGTTAGEQKGGL